MKLYALMDLTGSGRIAGVFDTLQLAIEVVNAADVHKDDARYWHIYEGDMNAANFHPIKWK